MLLIDGRWDGLPAEVEDRIGGDLGRAGVSIDLDAVSDPAGTARVLDDHPEALGGYDAVVVIAPARAGWRGGPKELARLVERIGVVTPVLVVGHLGPVPAPVRAWPAEHRLVETLLLPAEVEPVSAARRIAAALHALLDQLEVDRGAAGTVVLPSAAAALIRDDLGELTVGRLEWIARVTRDAFGLTFAEVNLLRRDSIVTIASSRALPADRGLLDSLTAIALRTSDITIMADTRLVTESHDQAAAEGEDGTRFYAVCPIHSEQGRVIGTLCVSDTAPHGAQEFDFTVLFDLGLLIEGELIDAGRRTA